VGYRLRDRNDVEDAVVEPQRAAWVALKDEEGGMLRERVKELELRPQI
jgi:hypothetical protein